MIPHIDTSLYDYDLPEERIAKYPLPERDKSKLLVYNKGEICESVFANVNKYIPQGATLVFNNTKVIRARLMFCKETGAHIEIFCLEPLVPQEVQQAFTERKKTIWKCIIGNSKKWKEGELQREIKIDNEVVVFCAKRISIDGNTSKIEFSWNNGKYTFAEIIEKIGVMPIPPYLNRETEDIDTTRYQTIYSEHKGSVAAPTAGLHFTEKVLEQLKKEGHRLVNITLHVGAGTFKPVQTTEIEKHVMHTEHIVVGRDAIEALADRTRPLVAVGTTSVRTIESLYWFGVKLIIEQDISDGIQQWDAYNLPQEYSVEQAIKALLKYLDENNMEELHNQTQIMIMPGYKFRIVDTLITNFHQPHSTLLLLIGAFVGMDWQKIYRFALDNKFRFLSYGDSSILIPKKQQVLTC